MEENEKELKKKSTSKKKSVDKKEIEKRKSKTTKTAEEKKEVKPKSKKESESEKEIKEKVTKEVTKEEVKVEIKEEPKEEVTVEDETKDKKKKKKDKNNTYSFFEVLIIMILTLALGLVSGAFFVEIISENNSKKDKDLIAKFEDAYETILDKYYGEVNQDELIENAINGMLSGLDDHTAYTDVTETTDFLERVNGKYSGIGCEISMTVNNEIIIVSVFEDSPALEAGLQAGDIVLKVDGEDYSEKTSTDVSNYVKNSGKEQVVLEVKRGEEILTLTINIKEVGIPSVSTEVFEKNGKKVGYMYVSIFSSITNDQFKEKLLSLENEGIDSLIIDVRYNSGGHLNVVTDIASLFLSKDKIIYQLQDQDETTPKYSLTNEKRTYPIAVLVNGSSASASEILAAAIKESYGGYVVGTKTYGKATVQQTKMLNDGSMIKYTIQNWLTPNGNFIDGVGVEPTDVVEQSDTFYQNPTYENDAQFQKALELLTK